MVSWGVSIKLLCLERSCHSKILFRQLLKKKNPPIWNLPQCYFFFFCQYAISWRNHHICSLAFNQRTGHIFTRSRCQDKGMRQKSKGSLWVVDKRWTLAVWSCLWRKAKQSRRKMEQTGKAKKSPYNSLTYLTLFLKSQNEKTRQLAYEQTTTTILEWKVTRRTS